MVRPSRPAGLSPVREGQALPRGTVTYRSRGAVLVIGDDAGAAGMARNLGDPLKVLAFAPGAQGDLRGNPRVVGGRVTRVEGHLGAFRASALAASGESDIGAFSPNADGTFDLVLDLSRIPLLERGVLPPGYFAPGSDPASLGEALEALRGLIGVFAKPRYFAYDAELCAHGARGLRGCEKCLASCAAGAIHSAGERIEVDAHLCQGCAACTLSCPTGAIAFADPPRATSLALLDAAARAARDRYGRFDLVVHEADDRKAVDAASCGRAWAVVESGPLPAFGEELWFAALALGAGAVTLVRSARMPRESVATLDTAIATANALLGGETPARIRMAAADDLGTLPDAGAPLEARAALRFDPGSKRGLLHDALGLLPLLPSSLPAGTAFGTIRVDAGKCTLCSGCANVCPTGAIGFIVQPAAELAFTEEACVQCGLCVTACPEDAIALEGRIASAATRRERRILVKDEPARCPGCGSPFMSRRLIEASLSRLGPELGLGAADLERLRLCPACRQEAMFRQS